MGRVGHEPALVVDAFLETREHLVERHRKRRELVATLRHRHSLVEPVDADLSRGRRHLGERCEGTAREEPATSAGRDQRQRPGEQHHEDEPRHGVIGALRARAHQDELRGPR